MIVPQYEAQNRYRDQKDFPIAEDGTSSPTGTIATTVQPNRSLASPKAKLLAGPPSPLQTETPLGTFGRTEPFYKCGTPSTL
eukprot:2590764-Pyramimonas_sp.AAC.1